MYKKRAYVVRLYVIPTPGHNEQNQIQVVFEVSYPISKPGVEDRTWQAREAAVHVEPYSYSSLL